MRRRSLLAGLAGLTGAAAAGAVAQRHLLDSIATDPEHERLRRPLVGEELRVRGRDGTALHVEAFGSADAPKVVLVHGWMCRLEFWRYQIEELAQELRVIAYDQRGHGRSAEAGDYSFDAFASDLGAVLDACLPAGERAVLAGHSMGAMTAVAWAGLDPAGVRRRLKGALLLNTGLGDLITESVIFRAPERLSGLRGPLGRVLMTAPGGLPSGPSPVGDAAVRYLALSPAASPARVAFCRRMLLSSNPKARSASGAAMARMDLWHALEWLDVPTTVIAGELDKLTPPPLARRLSKTLPDLLDYLEIPGVGHMTPVEAPGSVAARIRELAARGAPRAESPARVGA